MSHEDRIHTLFKVHLSSNSSTTVCKDNFVLTQHTIKQVFALFQKYLKQTNKSDIIMNLQIKDFSLKCSATPTAMPTQYDKLKTKSTQYSGTSIFQALIFSCFGTGVEGFDSKAKICDGLFQKSFFQVYLNISKLEILKSHYTVCFLFSSSHTKWAWLWLNI